MPSSRILRSALVVALLACPLAAQAAPAPAKPKPSLVATIHHFLGDLGATLTAWIGQEGSGVDPFGNHLASPPQPSETSGSAPLENRRPSRLTL